MPNLGPVDIVLQIDHFLSIKDSLSCKEPAVSKDKAARNMPYRALHFHTDGGNGKRCDSKVYQCSLKMEMSISRKFFHSAFLSERGQHV